MHAVMDGMKIVVESSKMRICLSSNQIWDGDSVEDDETTL